MTRVSFFVPGWMPVPVVKSHVRLNRTGSTPYTRPLSAPKRSGQSSAPAETESQATEQWTGSGGQPGFEEPEPELVTPEDEDIGLLFSGIREGLSVRYLKSAQLAKPSNHNPQTLTSLSETFSDHSPEFSLRQLPEVPASLIEECSPCGHQKARLLQRIQELPTSDPASPLALAILHSEHLLAEVCSASHLEESGGREVWLLKLTQEAGLPSDANARHQLEASLWSEESGHLYEQLREYSQEYFAHRYCLAMAEQTKLLLKTYFTPVFLDLPLKVQVLTASKNNAGHEWVAGSHRLTLQIKEPFGDARFDLDQIPTEGSFGTGRFLRRGISDLVSFVHEYAHGIFDKTLGVPASIKLDRVARSLSEGFAVLCELLAIDILLRMDAHHAFENDHAELAWRRSQRIDWLQTILTPDAEPATWAYAEGVELMSGLFREGGLEKILSFLKSLEANKANGLSRQHPSYREAIGKPSKILRLVGR